MEKQAREKNLINNQFYDDLGKEWLNRLDHPIALLRAENAVRVPWIIREIALRMGLSAKILDVGCGGGLLTNPLAKAGFDVTGIDLSQSSLDVAKESDATQKVKYLHGNAYSLPFNAQSFDVVCAMDILEHVENPNLLIQEASRVLKPGGLFFFHTFNRTPLSYWTVIKGVEWFIRNTPSNMHVYSLFITPAEIKRYCMANHLQVVELVGLQPKLFSPSLLKMALSRKVPSSFSFKFSKSLKTGYCGIAIQQDPLS